jgi:hypothetical protein
MIWLYKINQPVHGLRTVLNIMYLNPFCISLHVEVNRDLDKARTIQDIFEIAKELAKRHLGTEQAGLLVALSDLGAYGQSFIGAYYAPFANTIVINRTPLDIVKNQNPDLYKPYVLMILLHEYVHSLGIMDEAETRLIVHRVLEAEYGEEHTATMMAASLDKFLPQITMGIVKEPENLSMDYLTGIDRKNTNYIQ